MSTHRGRCTVRSFRDGDEGALAELFNSYMQGFFGPVQVTPQSWRDQYRREGWTGPAIETDRHAVRVAERDGEVVGYAVTDYNPLNMRRGAVVQELCVAKGDGSHEVVHALLADAEARALRRGKIHIETTLSLEDNWALSAIGDRGYEIHSDTGSVFMALVLDLPRILADVKGELRRRLRGSTFRDWEGVVAIQAGGQPCLLRIAGADIAVETSRGRGEPDVLVTVDPEALAPLLMGRTSVGELFSQDMLAVAAADRDQGLRLLAALFPRLPAYLPRAQWW
jgi:hypothetical protein